MKHTLICLSVALVLGACSSTKIAGNDNTGSLTPVNAQKLTTNFNRKGVKLEWDCVWGTGMFDSTCVKGDIKSIEVTAYATSFGSTESNREEAFKKAKMLAQGKLSRFIKEDINTSSVVNTFAKNVEKANDILKSKITMDEVQLSEDEANKEKNDNTSTRTNTNETVHTMTESVRSQSQSIQRGVYVKDETIVDRQTVQVTIRWDKDSQAASKHFEKIFR
jgi:hypothetical protein